MSFDISTVIYVAILCSVLSALVLASGLRSVPATGMREAMLSVTSGAVGLLVFVTRPQPLAPLAMLLGNILFWLAAALLHRSVALFAGARRPARWPFVLAAAAVPPFAYLVSSEGLYGARVLVTSAILAAVLVAAVVELARHDGLSREPARRFTFFLLAVCALGLLVRIGVVLLSREPLSGPLSNTLVTALGFVPSLVFAQGFGPAFLLMQRERSAVQARADQLRQTLAAIPQLVWTARPTGEIEYFNPRWAEYLGHEPVMPDPVSMAHPDDRALIQESWRQARATGEACTYEARLLRAADQRWRWHLVRALAVRQPGGAIERWIGTATDIDAQKSVEHLQRALVDEAGQARLRAEEANRIKDQFLATVSHELRTPLSSILGWSTILTSRPNLEPDLLAKGLAVIQRNAQSQAKLIDDILDVSRVLTGKLRIEPRDTDLLAVVNEALDSVRPSALAKNVALSLAVRGEPGPFRADPERLRQIVWNLLSNAVKFTPAEGRVEVEVVRGADDVTLRVRDFGEGIAPEFLAHVFERFRQADGSKTRRHGGLGLGLSIVRHLVELHGGEVSAESEGRGRGATFTVVLPAHRGERPEGAPVAAAAGAAVPQPALHGRRVVVVDDERDARELVAVVLEEAGAEVRAADSAAAARALVDAFEPHLLVSDIGMPDEDGLSLMRGLRAQHGQRPLRAVALTAYAREEDEQAARAAGFDAFLAKPLEPARLLALLQAL